MTRLEKIDEYLDMIDMHKQSMVDMDKTTMEKINDIELLLHLYDSLAHQLILMRKEQNERKAS